MELSALSPETNDLETVFEESFNPVCIMTPVEDPDGRWTFVYSRTNRAFRDTFWDGSGGNLGKAVSEVFVDSLDRCQRVFRLVHQTGEPQAGEVFIASLAKWFFVRISRAASGNLVVVHNEITEKEQYRKDADQQRRRYRQLFEMGAAKLAVSAATFRVLEANALALSFLGCPLEVLQGLRLDEFTDLSQERLDHALSRLDRQEAIFLTEQTLAQGQAVSVTVHVSRLLMDEEWVYLLIVFDRDAATQRRIEVAPEPALDRTPVPESQRLPQFSAFRNRHIREFWFLDELIGPLARLGRIRRYRRGENFIAAGDSPAQWGMSPDGVFRTYFIDAKGNEVTLSFHRPGEFLASYSSLISGEPSCTFIEALNECEVFVIDAQEFYHRMVSDPRWYMVCYRELQLENSRREQREVSLLSASIRQRYMQFIEKNRDILGLLHNYHIASHLGTTPETISRVRKWTSVHPNGS